VADLEDLGLRHSGGQDRQDEDQQGGGAYGGVHFATPSTGVTGGAPVKRHHLCCM
jgi:hypothetical protein